MKKLFIIIILIPIVLAIACSSSTKSDNTKPNITIIQPQNNETINDSIYSIEVSATDSKSINSITIYIDSIEVASSSGKYDCTYDWHTYYWTEKQEHLIQVTAMDDNLNTTTKNIDVTLAEEAYVTPKLLSPDDGSQLQNPLEFSWSSLPEAIQYQIHITINDTPFLNTATDTVYSNSFLIYGNGTWKVSAENGFGMSTNFSEEKHFVLEQN